jgi:hypothetical protein
VPRTLTEKIEVNAESGTWANWPLIYTPIK